MLILLFLIKKNAKLIVFFASDLLSYDTSA